MRYNFRAILSNQQIRKNRQMTELYFKGKEFVYNHHLAVPHRPLVPDESKSVGKPNLSGNLIIQGDNLQGLKALLPFYAGKVDCIFIDPPYNTGNEGWSYNDRVNAPMIKEWLNDNPVGVDDGLRHDKWCAMMWPRLKLLHELLAENGSFWMTLDDNEAHRGKLLLDEIFGAENFVGTIAWKKTSGDNKPSFAFTHDNIIVYGKSSDQIKRVPLTQQQLKRYGNPDNDERGDWTDSDYRSKWTKEERKNLYYGIKQPITGEVIYPDTYSNSLRVWSCSYETHLENEKNNLVWWGIDGKSQEPRKKSFLSDHRGVNTRSIWLDSGTNDQAGQLLKQILGNIKFDNPKPKQLVKKILDIATDSESLILDSFAGSGTTAHAVLAANKEDGGNRKFILVEMEDHIASPVTAERVRRVINGYEHKGKTTEGLGGSFTYCTLGEPIDLNRILSGDTLPAYKDFAPVLFHMATNQTLDTRSINADKFYVGETEHEVVWMVYQPKLDWLKSDAAALTLSRARAIQATNPDKHHLVFAPARFVSEKVLKDEGLKVAYVPFPYALYRIERD